MVTSVKEREREREDIGREGYNCSNEMRKLCVLATARDIFRLKFRLKMILRRDRDRYFI